MKNLSGKSYFLPPPRRLWCPFLISPRSALLPQVTLSQCRRLYLAKGKPAWPPRAWALVWNVEHVNLDWVLAEGKRLPLAPVFTQRKKSSYKKKKKGRKKDVKMYRSTLEPYPVDLGVWVLASGSQVQREQLLPYFEVLWENAVAQRLPTTKSTPEPSWMGFKGHNMSTSRTRISPPSIHNNPTTALKPQWHSFNPKQTCHYQSQINWCHLCALPVGFHLEPAQQQWPPPLQTSRHSQLWPWQNSLSCSSSPLWLQPFSPSHSLPTLRLRVILKWVSSRMKLSVEQSFALSKCLCCISWILKYTFVFVLTPLKLGYSL